MVDIILTFYRKSNELYCQLKSMGSQRKIMKIDN